MGYPLMLIVEAKLDIVLEELVNFREIEVITH